jgi:N6-L-threonylcarbamoyladenine synthase
MNNIRHVIESALNQSNTNLSNVGGISVTCRPGLSGALLVGLQLAKGLAWATDKPIVGVDHLVGHLLAVYLKYEGIPSSEPELPFVALLVSGGHTALYRVDGPDLSQIRELGATRDDAAGEAFDKVAKLLGLGYPGGPVIDRLAAEGDPTTIELSRPMPARHSFEFSFSGLKTNVMRHVAEHGQPKDGAELRNLCASFQFRIVETLVRKAVRAARSERVQSLVIGGGVAANLELRATLKRACDEHNIRLFVPPVRACTDNAAMIAYAGSLRLRRGESDASTLVMSPHTALSTVTRKGPGRRDPRH